MFNCPPLSSVEVKERVGPYLFSHSVPSWQVIVESLPLITIIIRIQVFWDVPLSERFAAFQAVIAF